MADRATTAGVCVDVSGADTTAVSVGVKLPAQAVIPAQAQAQLQPVLAKVSTVAAQHAALPIGIKLQKLADAITSVQQLSPTDLAALRSATTSLGSAGKDVVAVCAGAAR